MQDFYSSQKDLSEQLFNRYTNPQQPPKPQGNTIGMKGYSADFSTFPTDVWWQDFDWLSNRYPALTQRIQQLRAEGINDDIINDVIVKEIEPHLNLISNSDNVNKALGRTQQSMELDRKYQEYKQFQGYKQAFPNKSDQDITNAIWVSQKTGISATNLLTFPELFKKVTEEQLLNYRWLND